jgi:NADPH:quinone reductase-like Zn-dependent oxidoreductase
MIKLIRHFALALLSGHDLFRKPIATFRDHALPAAAISRRKIMRAYQLPKGGAGIEALVQVERPDPKPAYRQVLVKVKACSLNFRDFAIARGSYRMPVRENIVPLSDGAGEVVEIGPGVARVGVGDRVAGNFFQRWSAGAPAADVHKSALGGGIDGMLADYALLEEDGVVKIPPHLSRGGRDAPLRRGHGLARDV